MKSIHSIRLDADLRRRLEEFRVSSGLETPSQAIRAALLLGLEHSVSLDAAWRRAVTIEAAKSVSGLVQEQMQTLLDKLRSGTE